MFSLFYKSTNTFRNLRQNSIFDGYFDVAIFKFLRISPQILSTSLRTITKQPCPVWSTISSFLLHNQARMSIHSRSQPRIRTRVSRDGPRAMKMTKTHISRARFHISSKFSSLQDAPRNSSPSPTSRRRRRRRRMKKGVRVFCYFPYKINAYYRRTTQHPARTCLFVFSHSSEYFPPSLYPSLASYSRILRTLT